MPYTPTYIKLHKDGVLKERIEELNEILKNCTLCPHECKIDRTAGHKGICGAGWKLEISSAFAHFGEERPLVGRYGSGTIFLIHCNLKCVFCQNYDISHLGEGREITKEDLVNIMIYLQSSGCHNINFVTPTHYVPQIVSALPNAIEKGLKIPLVYNCGGYESVNTLKLLDGIIDIYMPDAKFASSEIAVKYTKAKNYAEVMKESLKEMYRQVGDLVINSYGIAERGLLIRHLVMPFNLAGTKQIMEFLANEISINSFVNVMAQYHPCNFAYKYNELNRRITNSEFLYALKVAEDAGIKRADSH
jgi:putative pyruvate formate lyase activating enzyme